MIYNYAVEQFKHGTSYSTLKNQLVEELDKAFHDYTAEQNKVNVAAQDVSDALVKYIAMTHPGSKVPSTLFSADELKEILDNISDGVLNHADVVLKVTTPSSNSKNADQILKNFVSML